MRPAPPGRGRRAPAATTTSPKRTTRGPRPPTGCTYNGVDLDISLDGDVSVAGANSSAHAEAYFGTGTPDGPVYAQAQAQGATGLWVSGSSKASGPTTLTLDYTGTMTITGGDASAEAHGTSTATINTLDDVPSSVPPNSLVVSGGSATGIYDIWYPQFETIETTIDAVIRPTGGNADGTLVGDNLSADITGGLGQGFALAVASQSSTSLNLDLLAKGGDATGLLQGTNLSASVVGGTGFAGSMTPAAGIAFIFDQEVTAVGGGASVTLDGSGNSATVSGGGASGIYADAFANSGNSYTQGANITVTGGDATGTVTGDGTVTVYGGHAEGLAGSVDSFCTLVGDASVFRNEATITATGGNASLTGAGTAIGGSAVGFLSYNFYAPLPDGSPQVVEQAGTIIATGGTGPDGMGEVQGVRVWDFADLGYSSSGDYAGTYDVVRVTGPVTVTGDTLAPLATDLSGNFEGSAGIHVSNTGRTDVYISGTQVTANGIRDHGVLSRSANLMLTVEAGATVQANGPFANGVLVLPGEGYVYDAATNTYSYGVPAQALIVIDDGGTIASAQGAGIVDDNHGRVFDYNANMYVIAERDNTTTVDVAGTLSGGNGTAMDLGTGADTLILRSTAVVTGAILLGAGNDTLALVPGGVTLTGPVDGGAGEDAILVDVASGDTTTVDIAAQPVTNFEVIEKTGAGTLTLDGGSLPNAYRLDALGGLTTAVPTTPGDFANLDVRVGDGATVKTDHEVGAVTTESGGTFGGNATVASLVNNGVVSPGNSIGTISVAGDVVIQHRLDLRGRNSGTRPGRSDLGDRHGDDQWRDTPDCQTEPGYQLPGRADLPHHDRDQRRGE